MQNDQDQRPPTSAGMPQTSRAAPASHIRRPSDTQCQVSSLTTETPTPPKGVVTALASRDTDTWAIVELTGAQNAAYIKEKIFSKLNIPDDDHAHQRIYRVVGDSKGGPLSDADIMRNYQVHGDSAFSLRFLVEQYKPQLPPNGRPLPPIPTTPTTPYPSSLDPGPWAVKGLPPGIGSSRYSPVTAKRLQPVYGGHVNGYRVFDAPGATYKYGDGMYSPRSPTAFRRTPREPPPISLQPDRGAPSLCLAAVVPPMGSSTMAIPIASSNNIYDISPPYASDFSVHNPSYNASLHLPLVQSSSLPRALERPSPMSFGAIARSPVQSSPGQPMQSHWPVDDGCPSPSLSPSSPVRGPRALPTPGGVTNSPQRRANVDLPRLNVDLHRLNGDREREREREPQFDDEVGTMNSLWQIPLVKRCSVMVRGPQPPLLSTSLAFAPGLETIPSSADTTTPRGVDIKGEAPGVEIMFDIRDFRPPVEDVYNRLDKFFLDHDFDKPVVDSIGTSGGNSPIITEQPPLSSIAPLPSDAKQLDRLSTDDERWHVDKGVAHFRRSGHKKSMRYIAGERKKAMDRTSKLGPHDAASIVLTKRSTKFWGDKMKEIPPDVKECQ